MSDTPAANLKHLLEASKLLDKAQQIDESLYQLQWGSALVVVGIKGRALVLISPMFKELPPGKEAAFCLRLLQLNSTLGGVANFAIQPDGWVVLQGGRDVKGMDAEEFALLLSTVAGSADQFDNLLLDEFYAPAGQDGQDAAQDGQDAAQAEQTEQDAEQAGQAEQDAAQAESTD